MTAIGTALTERLANPFRNLAGVYGPTAPRESQHVSVAELLVPMSQEAANRPWGKQANTGGGSTPTGHEKPVSGQLGASEIGQMAKREEK